VRAWLAILAQGDEGDGGVENALLSAALAIDLPHDGDAGPPCVYGKRLYVYDIAVSHRPLEYETVDADAHYVVRPLVQFRRRNETGLHHPHRRLAGKKRAMVIEVF